MFSTTDSHAASVRQSAWVAKPPSPSLSTMRVWPSLPKTMSCRAWSEATPLTTSSGELVPKPTIVRPTNPSPRPSSEAMPVAHHTSSCAAPRPISVSRAEAIVMAMRANGLGALMYTGAYRVPAPTLTGDIARDLALVAPVTQRWEWGIAGSFYICVTVLVRVGIE